jgi:hypothetical protein
MGAEKRNRHGDAIGLDHRRQAVRDDDTRRLVRASRERLPPLSSALVASSKAVYAQMEYASPVPGLGAMSDRLAYRYLRLHMTCGRAPRDEFDV